MASGRSAPASRPCGLGQAMPLLRGSDWAN